MRRGGQYLPGKPQDAILEFNQTLLHAIDNGFLTLGSVMVEPLCHRVEIGYQVKREEVPQKVPEFHRALQEVVEKQIAKNLNFTECSSWTIVEYVDHAKKAMEEVEACRRMRRLAL
jgi:hypothetical protein